MTHIRDLHPDDLDGVLHLWERVHGADPDPVYAVSEVLASCQKDHAVVAIDDGHVVGAAVGRATHAQGWIVFFAVLDAADADATGQRLLAALGRRMLPLGLSKLSVLVPAEEEHLDAFTAQGFQVRQRLRYLERDIPVQRRELEALQEVGGRLLPRGLWDDVAGMRREKSLLEQRLVTPLAEPELAARFGVEPPSAVILFGPPGTGKTTFAKAVASRLDWPFIELFPSRLASDARGLAAALRATFEQIEAIEHAVVFIDEVEEVAAHRHGDPPSPTQGVTNELLKIIPEFRDQPGRLLICATNFIRALDSAFLRHGRFDSVIPIGLPDTEARAAIWRRFLPEAGDGAIDLAALVSASDGLTPADIGYAARSAGQSALDRALERRGADGVTQDDYLQALRSTRATVPPAAVGEFLEDIEAFARL